MADVAAAQGSVARLRAAPLRLLGDERLADLAARGDRHAFAAIYERYHKPLYRYCVSLLGNPEDARDALQTTLLAALRGLERRPLDGALRPWLYRIAHNASVSQIRARRDQAELDERTAPTVDPPERAVAARERLGGLLRDLHSLSTRQRSALLLRELSGLPYAEIGATFAITPAAARQTVFDARSALAELAAGHDEQCSTIRRTLSDGDRRVVRGRRVRSHLAGCTTCRAFEEHLRSRLRVLALVPAPPAAAAAAALQSFLGATGGSFALVPGVLKGA
ncbi:MAG: sigma-70 family polymerase sigma factor, partial [Solirubrobacterales bacterium]|nr:sigma-70 family polymerase sigma factor [Solirubrobacterales bacterium]